MRVAPPLPDSAAPVFRRRVFYIPGYDPFHPRRYRELYRREGAAQAALSGYRLHQRKAASPYGWQVTAEIEGRQVETEIEVLVWSDIVRTTMDGSILGTYAQLVRTAWAYIGSGALFGLMRLRKGPIIAALYPILALILQAFLAAAAGGSLWALSVWLLPGWAGLPLGAVLGGGAFAAVLRWFRAKDGIFYAWYLMHDFSYSAVQNGANPPELEARMSDFVKQIRSSLTCGVDEVLVIGHSSGAHLGVSVLADLIRAGLPEGAAPLSFLSLGQVVPMVSFLPGASRLRSDLRLMGRQDQVAWVDVTAPGDGCAFALCDPVAVSGVAGPGQRWPLVLSAAFSQTLRPETWARLKRRYFRLHFQYLCAFDALPGRADDYDYFRITAGPMTLWQRLGTRPPSKSRIDRAVNRHNSLQP